MAPSNATLEKELRATTVEVFRSDERGELSVNLVRRRVEEKLALDEGFMGRGPWKGKSKNLIRRAVEELNDNDAGPSQGSPAQNVKDEDEDTKAPAKAKPGTRKNASKRKSSEPTAQPTKKQRGPVPVKKKEKMPRAPAKRKSAVKKDEDESDSPLSELSEPSEPSDSETEGKSTPAPRAVAKGKRESGAESEPDLNDSAEEQKPAVTPRAAVSRKRGRKNAADSATVKTRDSSPEAKGVKEGEDIDAEVPVAVNQVDKSPDTIRGEDSGEDGKSGSTKREEAGPVAANGTKKEAKAEDDEDTKQSGASDEKETIAEDEDSGEAKQEAVDEEEEYSDVIDEPLPAKRKKKGGGAATGGSRSNGSAPARSKKKGGSSSAAAAAAGGGGGGSDNPDDTEIKKLQSQLVKCGIRKIWGVELKRHGDDAKAKIRHLREMLHEVGMPARFSEARAREIRERRELLADVEAVNVMNVNWGADGNGPGRASRSRAAATAGAGRRRRPVKDEGSDGDDDTEDDSDGGEDGKAGRRVEGGVKDGGGDDGSDEDEEEAPRAPRPRGRGARAGLAFLDDESESD